MVKREFMPHGKTDVILGVYCSIYSHKLVLCCKTQVLPVQDLHSDSGKLEYQNVLMA